MSNSSSRPAFFKNIFAWTGIAAGKLLARLPWGCYHVLARPLSWIMQGLMRRRAAIAAINIQRCFPELSVLEQQQLRRKNFDSVAFSLFEFTRSWWGCLRAVDQSTPIIGIEHIHQAQAQGRSIILISAHFTTMEYCARILCQHVQMAGMYRAYDAAALEWSVKQARTLYAHTMFQRNEVRQSLRYLKAGGVLWFAPDQETRVGESVFVPFFNQMASSVIATHKFAALSGAAVIPFFHQRKANGQYHIELWPALDAFPSQDAEADTARVMHTFEHMIRRCPEQYLWMHARFKRQPDGQNPYQSRN